MSEKKPIYKRNMLGKKIAAYRKRNNWTQMELSIRTGITRDQISRLELGKSQPRLETVIQLEKAFSLPRWSLIEDSMDEFFRNIESSTSAESRIIARMMRELMDRALTEGELQILEKALLCMADSIHESGKETKGE